MPTEDIRNMEWIDLENIREFQPEGWSDIAELFRYNLLASFCLPVKLVREDRMVAVGNIIFNQDTAWLSQIIVHPAQRNKGLGTAVTKALLDRIDAIKFKTVLLDATFLGYPVYKKLGFELVSEYLHLTSVEDRPQPTFNSSFIKPFEEKYREQIFALDRAVTGENRALKLMEEMNRSLLWIKGGKVEGVYFPFLGKGPIIASQPEAGIELMQCRMSVQKSAMFPIENTVAAEFLFAHQWVEARRSRRMILGEPLNWKPAYIYNVISGAFG